MSEHKNHQREDSRSNANYRPYSPPDEKPKPTSESASASEASTKRDGASGRDAKDSRTPTQVDGAKGADTEHATQESGGQRVEPKNGMASDEKSIPQGLKGLAEGIVEQAKHVAETKVTDQKTKVADGLGDIAHALRQATSARHEPVVDAVKPYVDKAADRLENVSTYVQDKTLKDMAKDLEDFARREPALFLGGALAIGLIGGRFLKSASPRVSGSGPIAARGQSGNLGAPGAGSARISGIGSTDGSKATGGQPSGDAFSRNHGNHSPSSNGKYDTSPTYERGVTPGNTTPTDLVKDFKEAVGEKDTKASGRS